MSTTAVQAHRGSPDPAAGIRENTLAAFAEARRLGADGVELDVRLTRDGALAVHHDPVVAGTGPVAELVAGELPDDIPLLDQALEACAGLTVNIEIKNLPGEPAYDPAERAAEAVARLVVERSEDPDVVVSSFWPGSLDAVHRVAASVPTGLLVASWFDPADCVALALGHTCTALHPHASLVTEALVADAHRAGLAVAAWTVNTLSELERMAQAGVDTVITDDVPLALSLRVTGPGPPTTQTP
jgi:glycerophosphoryl diester phosphodiesterase